MLKVDNINFQYGDVQVIHEVTLEVEEKEIITMVGANGAGKTTLLKTIAGILRPTSGEIYFLGERIDHLYSHHIVEKGVVRIPEGRKVFPTLSVLENLELGSYLKKAKAKRSESLERVFSLFPILKERSRQSAGTLSGVSSRCWQSGEGSCLFRAS